MLKNYTYACGRARKSLDVGVPSSHITADSLEREECTCSVISSRKIITLQYQAQPLFDLLIWM